VSTDDDHGAGDALVVLVAPGPAEAAALGDVARELTASGGRAAVFTGDVTQETARAALREMIAELR
jgi:hypothetical protein